MVFEFLRMHQDGGVDGSEKGTMGEGLGPDACDYGAMTL
jgi:hypothetical protein